MKNRRVSFILAVSATLMLTACAINTTKQPVQETETQRSNEQSQQSDSTTSDVSEETSEATMDGNVLIAYFTVPETDGVDTVSGASRVATADGVLGNTQFIAAKIQKHVGGDLFAIETVQEYPETHDELLEFAYNEKSDQTRPALSNHIDNLDDYDYIFVGYPNWNADLPMPLYSFFDEYDFSGKTIIPFVTHGGSGFSKTIRTIQDLELGATVVESGLSVSRNDVADAQAVVQEWVDGLGL